MNELDKKYNDLIKSYENEILKELKLLETDYKYNLYYNMLIDLFNYIQYLKNKNYYFYNKHYTYLLLNINFKYLNLNYYNDIDYKEKLKEKYNKKFNMQIIKENDLIFLIYFIINDNNINLYNKIINIDLKELDQIIFYILEFLLNDFLKEFYNNNNYLEFLRILKTNINIIKDILENYYIK